VTVTTPTFRKYLSGVMWGLSLGIHSFIYFNSGNNAHKTTDKRSDIKTYTNIKTQKDRQRIHWENCTDYRGVCE